MLFRSKFEELREKMTKAAEDVGKKIAAVLNESQKTRLSQIVLQQQGNRALTSKDTIAKLSITKEQQQQIKDLMDAQGEMTRELFSGLRELQDLSREERTAKFAELGKKREEITTETNKAVMAVLTASQKTQFEQLKGAEFKLERRSFGGRRPGQGGGNRRPGQENGNRRPQNNNN